MEDDEGTVEKVRNRTNLRSKSRVLQLANECHVQAIEW